MCTRQTKNSHVKTNLVHTLYRVQKYGVLDLEKFKELLSPEEVKACLCEFKKDVVLYAFGGLYVVHFQGAFSSSCHSSGAEALSVLN